MQPAGQAPRDIQIRRSRALEIQGRYAMALDALPPAEQCDDPIVIEQGLRLTMLTARWDKLALWEQRYLDSLEQHVASPRGRHISPGMLNYLPGSADLHARVAGLFATQLTGLNSQSEYRTKDDGSQRLRVGYMSADFQEHAVGYLLADLFTAHDRERVIVHGYDLQPVSSPLATTIRSGLDEYRPVQGLSNQQLAGLIVNDGIHVLVDMAGYSRAARPGALAMRPAPVILSWLGYLNTMNASFVDGIAADPVLLPDSLAETFRESPCYLPGPFTPASALPVAELAARQASGLPENRFVFACFNNAFKLRPKDLDRWATILNAVPGSVLWLYSAGIADLETGLRQQAEKRGLNSDRLIFAPWLPMDQHMARMPLADLFLDTLNYNAGATAVCALSAGVPVLTQAGTTMLARMGTSLNAALGLEALSATDEDQYIDMAITLATEPDLLRAIQSKLAPGGTARNPLFPVGQFASDFETLLENVRAS